MPSTLGLFGVVAGHFPRNLGDLILDGLIAQALKVFGAVKRGDDPIDRGLPRFWFVEEHQQSPLFIR